MKFSLILEGRSVMLFFWYPLFLISACNCNSQGGSNGSNCNANGVCNCKTNIVGDKCTECVAGYFNFPLCEGKYQ